MRGVTTKYQGKKGILGAKNARIGGISLYKNKNPGKWTISGKMHVYWKLGKISGKLYQ